MIELGLYDVLPEFDLNKICSKTWYKTSLMINQYRFS